MIVRKLEALFGFKIDTAQFSKATSAIDNFADNANTAMGALAGHFAIQTIKDFVDSTTEAMANVGKTASYLGISTSALEELRYAAEKSGVSIDTLDDSFKELQIRAVDAKSGTGEAAEAFAALGLKTTDAAGRMREPLELLSEVADRLNELPTQSDRIWVVDSMFGDQGAEMLKILKDGSLGLATMRQEARDLGYILDDTAISSAIEFRQAITSLKAALSGMVRTVTKSLLPAMTSFAERSASMWVSASAALATLNDNTSVIRTAFIALGLVLAGLAIKALIAFAPMLVIGAMIAGAALLIDDLWTAFSGGESVSKRVFEAIMGWFQSLKAWVASILRSIWDFLPADLRENLKAAFSVAKAILESIATLVMTILQRAWGFVFDEFGKIFLELKTLGKKIFDELSEDLIKAFLYAARAFVDHIAEAVANVKALVLGIKDVISDAVPDFVKKGFSAAVNYVGGIGSKYDQKPSQHHMTPQPASSSHIQNRSTQNVSVSVNVKSGANAHEIGGEVSKAVRKELEKERMNAFMGVNRYAY
jgi:hypothetical protein